ncbi:DUF559 domain-containing protein [Streptomyces sp. NPDC057620]|uniref:DUF559 domain-containing protein n=1 Tax=Streptomyces sp. NPDC057620 TaxID=3346185 RepID=UPI003689E378
MTSIYLAGKIGKNDWRHDVVGRSLKQSWPEDCYSNDASTPWPIIKNAVIDHFDYVGPYFIGDDHGCGHGAGTHGCGADGSVCGVDSAAPTRQQLVPRCFAAIDSADIFFAWLDDVTAYGTLVELGYAKARGKTIYTAGPQLPETFFHGALLGGPIDDLWFAFECGTPTLSSTPRGALTWIAEKHPRLESPIEQAFWNTHLRTRLPALSGLRSQVPALRGRYRIDFALPSKKIGIELDGYAWHSSREAFTKDRERQRALELDGWRIIRFSGAEVNGDTEHCVKQAAALVEQYDRASAPAPLAPPSGRRPGGWPVARAAELKSVGGPQFGNTTTEQGA